MELCELCMTLSCTRDVKLTSLMENFFELESNNNHGVVKICDKCYLLFCWVDKLKRLSEKSDLRRIQDQDVVIRMPQPMKMLKPVKTEEISIDENMSLAGPYTVLWEGDVGSLNTISTDHLNWTIDDPSMNQSSQSVQEISDERRRNAPAVKRSYKCNKCVKIYKTETGYKRHYKTHEVTQETILIVCKICKKTFTKMSGIVNHSIVHKEKHLQCAMCTKMYKRKGYLQRHMTKVHEV